MRLLSGPSSDRHHPNDQDMSPQDDVGMSSEENTAPQYVSVPPPHVVARFYPIPGSRRRTSASSSRRSSISSLHSHHSNRSAHGGPQSTHIAQHLRRASIIESRKARLADRAAHAEKVRLRAALAKATPRTTNLEERALAAQQTRERLLAEIAAKCEEEVKRAKKRAEEMRERKAAEQARLKEDMEEKFAEAAKRRLLYQQSCRRSRTTSLAPVDEKKVARASFKPASSEIAAKIIQRAWRGAYSRKVLRTFLSLEINIPRIRRMSFEEVGLLLSREDVLCSTAKMLDLCGMRDTDGNRLGDPAGARPFLSGFLILGFPKEVLSGSGEQEEDLVCTAQALIESLNCLVAEAQSSNGSLRESRLASLSHAYANFLSTFHAWKSHDSSALIETMVAQFVELDSIWQDVKDDHEGGVSQDYREGIRYNQTLLLSRLQKLAGREKANSSIKAAICKARRSKVRKQSPKEVKPRVVSISEEPDSGVPSSARAFAQSSGPTAPPHASPLSRPRELGDAMTIVPDNRILVHELAINKEFKIERNIEDQDSTSNVYTAMRQEVQQGLGTKWTVNMADFIKERLGRMLTPGNSLHVLISERLDGATIQNQCEAGLFSYDSFFKFMGQEILPRMCSPSRDEEVKKFNEDQGGDVIDRLARMIRLIDMTSLDYSNYMLQVAAPHLIEQAPGYEQRAFAHDIETGKVQLGNSRRFWKWASQSVLEEIKRRDPENSQPTAVASPSRIYVEGLVNLVFSNSGFQDEVFPEPFHLDRARLSSLHDQSLKIIAIGSVLLTAKNLLKRDGRAQWKPEAERLLSLDDLSLQPERVLSIIESSHPMPDATKIQLSSTIKRILARLMDRSSPRDTATFTDPVSRLLLTRLRSHVLGRLSASSASERVRATSTASEALASAGLPEFVSEVGAMVELLGRVRDCDLASHGDVWEQVRKEVEEEEER
jgi:hypothetical protein